MKTLLRFFFSLLYHQFAFTYDLVAATVSFNRWKDWVMSVLPFLEGKRILEIGHGPGHLQQALLQRGQIAVGIDESRQMGRLARRNLRREARSAAQSSLVRGIAQHLPFPQGTFDTLVATFPAEYIFDPQTLVEARRVLAEHGHFVILPGAVIVGRGVLDRFLAWVFRITGEAPANLSEILHERAREPFEKAGFHLEVHEIPVKSSLVFILSATKIPLTENTPYA